MPLKTRPRSRARPRGRRKIIVFIAVSADGYIARPDGDVTWLDRPRTAGHYGTGAFVRSIDTILWGRKTYDKAFGCGGRAATRSRECLMSASHRPPSTLTSAC